MRVCNNDVLINIQRGTFIFEVGSSLFYKMNSVLYLLVLYIYLLRYL